MKRPTALTRDIVLIGGGHTHALLLRSWGMDPLPGARLTLINPGPTAPYTGMLPGFVAGHYTRDELEIDLVRLARFAGARLIIGSVTDIDRDARHVIVPGRPPIGYDIASFDIGITSDMPEISGFQDFGIGAKPLGAFAERWTAHLNGDKGPATVIGGGIAGVELALAIKHAMGSDHAITVIERDEALAGVSDKAADALRDALRQAQIELIENSEVSEVRETSIILSDGTERPSILTVGAAGARPYDWLQDTGLELEHGYIKVAGDLRCTNDDRVFAVGDCAHLTASPRPKAGVFAVRAAPTLTHNLKAAVSGQTLRQFQPQSHYLKLVSLGGKQALADKWDKSVQGAWVWRWKDRIDRKFMNRLAELPAMAEALPAQRAEGGEAFEKPLCGGCGSKIGQDVLETVLMSLPTAHRADVLTGPGDDAAVLNVGGVKQVITSDHLRAFWDDPWVFGRIAALHALGDVWAMGARPQAVLAQITLPQMSPELQARTLSEIMQSTSAVFQDEGAEIVGGHSTLGAEMTVGFTITGLLQDRALSIDEAQPRDKLILTRPLGSGTVLAAEMSGSARGETVTRVLDTLVQSQGDAARVLTPAATAMTDVTGFGLAGHALRMAQASNVRIKIDLACVPFFEGAVELAADGQKSSIWSSNRAAFDGAMPDTPEAALLFDPQTAGGFLASVPSGQVDSVVKRLSDIDQAVAVIGDVEEGAGQPLSII